ncbi:hypothetical protein M408DRAFT_163606 [Serendipita vermifera MAFF 305830]|uniref:Uncharacterized protein n=1 Tax=Serendipita vermifera MAFF 305830 TaxID=933852 RepID=A0A0C2XF15_SERVB|nr:hypothetical protein M408DRAFT_163606 [Serendipita vermifera MAFF 305830]
MITHIHIRTRRNYCGRVDSTLHSTPQPCADWNLIEPLDSEAKPRPKRLERGKTSFVPSRLSFNVESWVALPNSPKAYIPLSRTPAIQHECLLVRVIASFGLETCRRTRTKTFNRELSQRALLSSRV